MKNILVTGGAGYIGSHACKALAKAGYTPICYDSLERGHEWAVKWGPLEQGNILDKTRLEEVLKQYQPEAVMHFAGYISVEESVKAPALYQRNNVEGSKVLIDAAVAHNIKQFIFSSTCAVHGIPNQQIITEDLPIKPINPYGESKAEIENVLRDTALKNDFAYVALRYFNAAGADRDGEIGEAHEPESHLIPLILDTAAGKREHISIYGTDYDTPDGTCVRDYIHVNDLAEGHVQALRYLEGNAESQVINLGTGKGFSVKKIIDCARKITGKTINEKVESRRAGDPSYLVASNDRAKTVLGWQPQHSQIETIIETAWRWHQTR